MRMKWFIGQDGGRWVEVSYGGTCGYLYNIFPEYVWKRSGGYVIAHIRAILEVKRTHAEALIRY